MLVGVAGNSIKYISAQKQNLCMRADISNCIIFSTNNVWAMIWIVRRNMNYLNILLSVYKKKEIFLWIL